MVSEEVAGDVQRPSFNPSVLSLPSTMRRSRKPRSHQGIIDSLADLHVRPSIAAPFEKFRNYLTSQTESTLALQFSYSTDP